jgi:DNA-binding NtrC family response regulator
MSERHILIVEDETQIAATLCQALNHRLDGTYRVQTSTQASDALAKLRDTHYDLIITDLRMPGMDGLELIRRVHRTRPQTHVILITGFGTPQVEEEARSLSADYLPKPFKLRELLAIVRRILGARDQNGIRTLNDIVER